MTGHSSHKDTFAVYSMRTLDAPLLLILVLSVVALSVRVLRTLPGDPVFSAAERLYK